jgi:hypothetical protein
MDIPPPPTRRNTPVWDRAGPRKRRSRIDDRHALEPLAQKAHAPVDFVQALLAVGVFGVLGAVTLRRSFGDGDGHARPFLQPELIEFIAQPLGAFRRDVLGAGLGGRAVS